jgi:hypothetical protein
MQYIVCILLVHYTVIFRSDKLQIVLYGKLYATRRRGRQKIRWLDDVSTDLRKMGINEWRDRGRDREVWKRIVMDAKAHSGL